MPYDTFHGACLSRKNYCHKLSVTSCMMQVKMVDTTGAGDAFSAGFIYKILQVRAVIIGQCGDRLFSSFRSNAP